MKITLAIEEIAMFLLAIFGFYFLPYSWWVFPALLFLPDLSMIAYAFGPKAGGVLYNLAHHKGIAIVFFIIGFYLKISILELTGLILFAHSSLDRTLGYGLKYMDAFNHTHLGIIGKNK